ncbi:hypothetical protein SAMN02745146_2916 [Hymenobacter daecheongensis DSM 21074]|uniref:Dolichyl-phosphate-mannose-protein mannosyltransferase n=1 Tax=Hymenobacter daecheongensis DSM 21074 TaxID=1121955 RepID=A0A1M6INX2_9BACT|nr:hypothetical protein [Hymenobacter daecheongensis]SHJ36141.1 hypothetical protein SAMN02745146_2916 [Hymenobacter daecheongensis DSM 21074]
MLLLPRRKSFLLVYLLALALLWSNAYLVLANHPAGYTGDERSYLHMAQGHFEVPVTHRYRVILPLLAGALAQGLHLITGLVSPSAQPPLGISFFLLNGLLLALAGLFVFRTARAHGAAAGPALIGMAAVMTCGAATYVTGLVLVDSAVVLAVVVLYYALTIRSGPLLLAAMLLGPVLKESFVLFLPLALLYGGFVPWGQRLLALLGAAGLLLGLHALVDSWAPPAAVGSVANALNHGRNVVSNLRWLFSARGLFICSGVYGLFNLVLLAGFWGGRSAIRTWLPRLQAGPAILTLLVVLAHMLLSGEMSRMLLLAAPVVATAVALILDRHPLFAPLRPLLGTPATGANPPENQS